MWGVCVYCISNDLKHQNSVRNLDLLENNSHLWNNFCYLYFQRKINPQHTCSRFLTSHFIPRHVPGDLVKARMLNNYGLGHFILIFASSCPGQIQDSLSYVLLLTSFSDTTALQPCHSALPSFTSVLVIFLQPCSLPKGAKRRAATAIPGSRSANSAEDGRVWAILEGKAPPCEDSAPQGAEAGSSYRNRSYYQNLLCSDREAVLVLTALQLLPGHRSVWVTLTWAGKGKLPILHLLIHLWQQREGRFYFLHLTLNYLTNSGVSLLITGIPKEVIKTLHPEEQHRLEGFGAAAGSWAWPLVAAALEFSKPFKRGAYSPPISMETKG